MSKIDCSAARVADGVIRMHVPTPFSAGPLNAYLLEGDSPVLIDCGPNLATGLQALEEGMAAHGYGLGDVGTIVLTHQHADHCGLAATLRHRTAVRVVALGTLGPILAHWHEALAQDDALALEVMLANGVEPALARSARAARSTARWLGAAVTVDDGLSDGEVREMAGRRLKVLHLPGHSPSDIVLVDEQSALAFTGDVLAQRIRSTTQIVRGFESDDPGAGRARPLLSYRRSLRALARLGFELALPGHGPAFGDWCEVLGQRLAETEHAAQRLHRRLGRRPRDGWELTSARRTGAGHVYGPLCETLGLLDLLCDEGVVECQQTDLIRFCRAQGA